MAHSTCCKQESRQRHRGPECWKRVLLADGQSWDPGEPLMLPSDPGAQEAGCRYP